MAHIGLLKAMQEREIEADEIAGASIGAVIGALYAHGKTTDEMPQFFKETPLFQYSFFCYWQAWTYRYSQVHQHF